MRKAAAEKSSYNDLAVRAASDEGCREELIRQQEQLILRTASRASYRYVTKSDDEWSVALCAFSDAIDRYTPERGDFLPFSQMLIRRALIDWHRSQASQLREVSTSPFVLAGDDEPEEEADRSVYLAVVRQSRETDGHGLREEIEAANELLSRYGFRFFDLTACSPQQEKTRQQCAQAIRLILSDEALFRELERKKKLPIRAVSSETGLSSKLLDRYRKYIIMAVLILHGDYPKLSEYLKFVRKEAEP